MVRAIDCPCGHQLMAATDETLFLRAKEHVVSCSLNLKPSDEELRAMIQQKAYGVGDQNRTLVRRYYEVLWNEGKLELIDELFSSDYVNHDPMHPEVPPGPAGARQIVDLYRGAFPDSTFRIEDLISEDDRVVTRWSVTGTHTGALLGLAPTNKRVTVTGITLSRIANDKVAETWANWDNLGLMQQLGAVPALAQAGK
jgi:steroid delta-isomerase-like uncharacterized protein